MQKGQYAVALGLAVEAAPNASDAKQLQAALAVRSAALAGLKDDAALIDVLEQRLLLGCHDASQSREDIQDQLRAARMRLGQR
jgi:recombinational DNA repair ATPase RecF